MAASVAMAGMDPMEFLECDDPVRVLVMLATARRWMKLKDDLDKNLANEIIRVLGKALKS